MHCEWYSWTTRFKNKSKTNSHQQRWTKSSCFLNLLRITASETTWKARQECWEGHAVVMTSLRTNADLCVSLVDWGLKRRNITSKLSADVNLSGAVVWNVRHVREGIPKRRVEKTNDLREPERRLRKVLCDIDSRVQGSVHTWYWVQCLKLWFTRSSFLFRAVYKGDFLCRHVSNEQFEPN